KHFRHTTQKTQTLIKARIKEGFTEKEFKQVIDNKVNEWKGYPKFEVYLRPETLFGTKFESYLNQQPKQTGQSQLERMKYDPSYWEE
ncbi:conserved phage C-terminal domain-containing protein, partial [Staphylococcus xylosus]